MENAGMTTELQLPEAMTAARPHLGELTATLAARSPSASVGLSSIHGLSINIDHQEEKVSEEPPSAGAVLRAFDGRTIVERSVGSFVVSDLQREVRALADSLPADGPSPFDHADGPSGRHDFALAMTQPPERVSLSEKLERCRNLQHRLRDVDTRVQNARVTYMERIEHSLFRSRRADLAQTIHRLRLGVVVVVRDGEAVRYNWHIKSKTGGLEGLEFSDEEVDDVVQLALRLLEAGRIEPGEYNVVTAPGVSGTICHESFGHGVETDMFVKERARAAHFLDQTVASPMVDIFDDPTVPGVYGFYFFDDEGALAGPTRIVEGGVFRGGITDLGSATILGIRRTANGRRQDYSRKAYARMSNTFFGPGQASLDELLAQAGDGIFLQKWSSGMEDPQGWGIQVTCHIAREIRDGRLTNKYFTPVAVSGYVPDVLKTVRGVGAEVRMEGGWCGKGHKEMIPVSSGGPHMLLRAHLG
jgi:TldD protein